VDYGKSGKEYKCIDISIKKAKGKKPPRRPKCRRNNNTKDVKEIIRISAQLG
jgi:hypothetical protein